jgi:hypothetical protein
MKRLVAGILAMSVSVLAHAQLVAPGTKATLTAEYEYSAVGSKPDRYDPRDWKVSRRMTITVQLVADKQQPRPSMHQPYAAAQADMKGKQEKARSVAKTMSPMGSDMLAIVGKCGEDEACITREVQKYSSTLEMTPELKQAGRDIDAIGKEGPPRYQMWKMVSQSGTFAADETYNAQISEVGEGASTRYTRNETRKGSGALPPPANGKSAAGKLVFEVDNVRKDIFLMLPVPLGLAMVTSTVRTTVPDQKSGTSQIHLGAVIGGFKQQTFAIPAGLNNAAGTETVKGAGPESEGGTHTVKWRITLQ